jgi:hypothetical protein
VDEFMPNSTRSIENALAQALDRIINANFSGRNSHILYEYFQKEKLQGTPLSLFAAKKTLARLEPDSTVLILTGFPIEGKLETDGPFGSSVIIKTLEKLQVKSIVITGPQLQESLIQFYSKVGLANIRVASLPFNDTEGIEFISTLFAETNPQLIIAIEIPGRNSKDQAHNMRGENITNQVPNFDQFFLKAREKGVLTLAIGDGGNELGMGGVVRKVREHIPYGQKCKCECNGGIATTLKADTLMIASVSNWGAYAYAGVLAFLSGIKFPHSAALEREYILSSKQIGLVDGVSGIPSETVDGISMDLDVSIVNFLIQILLEFRVNT